MYLDYYGLRQKPFEGTPDPSFFYYSKAHKEALAAMQYGVEQNKGLILISGDVGTGKTTLIHTYLKNLDSSVLPVYIDYPFVSMSQLLKYLAEKLGVTVPLSQIPLDLSEAIMKRLVELKHQGRRVVLIFDEAQHLSIKTLEFIRLLSNFQTEEEKLINIMLIGQTELLAKIESPELRQLRQRIVIQRVLTPLDFDETVNYIEHRLLVAGAFENPFTKKAVQLIFRETRGIPRLINVLCDNALLAGFIARSKSITPSIVKRVIKESLPDRHGFYAKFWKKSLVLATGMAIMVAIGWKVFDGKILWISREVPSGTQSTYYYEISSEALKSAIGMVQIDDSMLKEFKGTGAFYEDPSQNAYEENTDSNNQSMWFLSKDTNLEPVIKVIEIERGVKPREALLKIIAETYGKSNDTLLDIVQQHNPSLKNIDLLYAGQKIVLPKLVPESMILKTQDGKYFVHYYSSYNADRVSKKMKELNSSNLQFSIISFDHNGRLVYRLYTGPFDTISDARRTFQILPVDHLPFTGADKGR